MLSARTKIEILLAEAVYKRYKSSRYGLKSCRPAVDIDLAGDLRELLIRSKERELYKSKLVNPLDLTRIEERIKTL